MFWPHDYTFRNAAKVAKTTGEVFFKRNREEALFLLPSISPNVRKQRLRAALSFSDKCLNRKGTSFVEIEGDINRFTSFDFQPILVTKSDVHGLGRVISPTQAGMLLNSIFSAPSSVPRGKNLL